MQKFFSSCSSYLYSHAGVVLQGVTVEQVCRELRSLYTVRNLSADSSVSMICEPSLSANNEIHVSIVSHVCCHGFTFSGRERLQGLEQVFHHYYLQL